MGRKSPGLALACAACMAAVTGSAAFAGIPDADGMIHGCYKNSSTNQGALRVIDTEAGQACAKGETPLQWRQSSPTVAKVTARQTAEEGIIVPDSFSTIATITITAPTAGQVLVNGWATISGLAADQVGVIRLRDAVSGDVSNVQASRMAAGGQEAVSVGWLFPVSAGERVFELGTRGEFGTIVTGSATMTAVFVPD